MLSIAQLAPIKNRDPYLHESLVQIVRAINAVGLKAGLDPHGPLPAPAPIGALNVQAANGWFDIAITDDSEARPGLFYFAESDTTPSFAAPRVYFMGASRNLYLQLGNQTLYWRAYSQYLGSSPSTPVAFGNPPIAVVGGGASGPAPFASSGSGAFEDGLFRGGNGFGVLGESRLPRALR
jgi:hypothetical protein